MTSSSEAFSNFLENEALPMVLVAVIGGFLIIQIVRWLRSSFRSRDDARNHEYEDLPPGR